MRTNAAREWNFYKKCKLVWIYVYRRYILCWEIKIFPSAVMYKLRKVITQANMKEYFYSPEEVHILSWNVQQQQKKKRRLQYNCGFWKSKIYFQDKQRKQKHHKSNIDNGTTLSGPSRTNTVRRHWRHWQQPAVHAKRNVHCVKAFIQASVRS